MKRGMEEVMERLDKARGGEVDKSAVSITDPELAYNHHRRPRFRDNSC